MLYGDRDLGVVSDKDMPRGIELATAVNACSHPLGSVIHRTRLRQTIRSRCVAVLIACGLAAPLVLAGRIEPDPTGVGTHTQLGFPGCASMVLTGMPCPTCGMTTAFAHTVRGQWWQAVGAQPFGALLALMAMAGVCLSIESLFSGKRWCVNWFRIPPARLAAAVVVLFLAAWGYKMMVVIAPARGSGVW